jgi:lincosamide nucleotidyltransferase A/C/D/E
MAVLDVLLVHGVVATIVGGWGIDALLGRQTRTHGDLDLLVSRQQLQHATRVLSSLEFEEVRRDDVCLVRLQDKQRRRVDLHLIDVNRDGSATEQLPGGQTYRYTRESREVPGFIGGYPITCLSCQAQLLRHAGYRLRDDDRRDLRLLRDAPPTL